jgi:peroxiredoxin
MAALTTGTKAPEFELKGLDGKGFSLNDELALGPVVLAFFKVSCPTCQYALPFFERLHKAYSAARPGLKPGTNGEADAALKGRSSTVHSVGGSGSSTVPLVGNSQSSTIPLVGSGAPAVSLIGISQNDAKETAAFIKEFGITFPVLLEDTHSYSVSNAYGLTNVPTIFWIAQDGEIEVSSVGWLKADFEEMNRRMAEAGKITPAAMFRTGEDVRDFRAG